MGLEDYELEEIIAQSPRTVVRRAVRKADGRRVVVKALAREFPSARELGQAQFEFRVLKTLTSPGVIRAHGLEKDGSRLALILEDFGGKNLPTQAATGLPIDQALSIAITVTRTLGQIHSQGIIHKDIKPQNILVNPDTGEVRIIDFNISSELSQERQQNHAASQLEGSLPYMSPEQTGRMNRDLDYRSDYYSLGITLFEMLTGAVPFTAADAMGWVHCHISKPAPSPRDVKPSIPEPLALLCRTLLAKDPDDRYQSALGLLNDLETCLREWRDTGAIAPFALRKHDVSERFQLSQRLFGRDTQLDALVDIFHAASRGASKLVLVSGQPGVGKSSLVQAMQKPVAGRRGQFVAGKCDQLSRAVPYGALAQALRGLFKQMLAEPEDRLRAWRKRLGAALGAQAPVLRDLIPELETILSALGPQPPVPELDAGEARVRFQRVFRALIETLAQAEHPLVIFLDDLQWIDASTPELLGHLLAERDLRHLLVVGAYRGQEIDGDHPLPAALDELVGKRPDAVERMELGPLREDGVRQLVAELLRAEPAEAAPLGALVWRKTDGNPFFVNELLATLHRDGAFRYLSDEGRWSWDAAAIEKAGVSDNVVELMLQGLRRLPAATTACLRAAACLGVEFDLGTLATVTGRAPREVAEALWEAVQQQVLLPVGNEYRLIHGDHAYGDAELAKLGVRYRFKHDRIQQAAYSLLSDDEKAAAHLGVGRLLLAASRDGGQDAALFELVNHLNRGRALITDAGERRELAALNHRAGERARRSVASAIAASYFETSLSLLSPDEQAREPRFTFDCSRAHVECVFQMGRADLAAALCDQLFSRAPDRLSGAAAYHLKAGILEHQARLLDAVATIRDGLRLLGVELPEAHDEIDRQIGAGIGRMQGHLARTAIDDLVRLPEMTDADKIMTMDLLMQLVPPAIQTYPPLFVLAELMMFDLALTHGTTAASCKNFVDCGIVQGGILGDYPRAYALGKAALALVERYAPTPLESAVNFVFASFVSHWRAPFAEALDAYARAQRVGIEMGDIQHVAYTRVHRVHRLIAVGRDLAECHQENVSSIAYLKQVGGVGHLTGASLSQRTLARLRAHDDGSDAARLSDDDFVARVRSGGNAQWLYSLGQSQAMVSYFLGDLEDAAKWLAFAEPFLPAGTALFSIVEHYTIWSLVLAQRWAAAPAAEREATRASVLATLDAHLVKLGAWAENSPANFAHKQLLVAAEAARLRGAPFDEVLALYEQAIAAAGDDFVQMRALANERLGDLWIERRQRRVARQFLHEAYFLYERWGAEAKLRQLELAFPEWLGRSTETTTRSLTMSTMMTDTLSVGSLDLTSVIKATQAISGEIRPERLFAKLMETIIENAGAQRGCLILCAETGGELTVEATARVDGDDAEAEADAVRSIPIDEHPALCPEIVRYVARTGETLVIDDAGRHERYRADAYVEKNRVKSVLCLPVQSQGRLVGLLYVENNAATHAFTGQRISLLQVIASQAAISITNARHYDSLEEKVTERTRELAERNRDVAAVLNSMQQGIFTLDDRLVVQPQYSDHLTQILGTRDIAGRDGLELLFREASVGPDALDAMRSALQFGFGVPLFLAEVNTAHLVREFHAGAGADRRHYEVDWSFIAGEDGGVTRVLVVLRDVTLVKRLKETVATKSRELDIVGQVLDAGLEAFQRFCLSARNFAREIESTLRGDAPLTTAALELVFRNMHTIKGNARLLGLGHLVDTAHLAEEACDAARRAGVADADRPGLIASLETVLAALEEHEDVCLRKLGGLARGQSARLEQGLADIEAIVRVGAGGSAADALRAVGLAVARANAVPLGDVVAEGTRMLPSLARELRKVTPTVDCAATGAAALTPAWAKVLRDVLVHALRNALDHGIEPTEERLAAGKPAQGRVTLRIDRGGGGGTTIRIADDGRGLPLAVLREKLGDRTSRDEEIADKVFLSGVSSAARVSSISGRGVGLDAVRSFVRRQQGEARIAFTAPARAGHRAFELVLDLPGDALVPTAPEEPLAA
jgi:predicted ATPase/HPt (histidine-containing phosphotransfer) domain-containing protein